MEKTQTIDLPENYFRVFRSLAQLIEEKLVAMEETFTRFQRAPRVHFIYENDLKPETIMDIQEQIRQMYQVLQTFVERYQIPVKTFSLRKQILVQNAFLWEDLENSRSNRISGHGMVDQRVMRELDDFLDQMIQLSNHIQQIVEKD
ncbi:MAG: hypothetical protein K6T34_10170 [Thermoflavifilum sp.]|nr:hypothetical protein [Thermoflavifilum sp.]